MNASAVKTPSVVPVVASVVAARAAIIWASSTVNPKAMSPPQANRLLVMKASGRYGKKDKSPVCTLLRSALRSSFKKMNPAKLPVMVPTTIALKVKPAWLGVKRHFVICLYIAVDSGVNVV